MLIGELAPGIKCRNAGATLLSIDVPFRDNHAFKVAVASNVINAEVVAKMYKVEVSQVAIYVYEAANAIKITMPRGDTAGGIDESDFDGAQQFAPLLELDVPFA